MDTSQLDSQTRQHLTVYKNFMTFSKISIIAIISVLVIMAVTLL